MTSDPPTDDPLEGLKYLPGLEGDPAAAVVENWTNADFDRWFAEELDGSEDWTEFLNQRQGGTGMPGLSINPGVFADNPLHDEPSAFDQALEALAKQASSTTADGALVIGRADFGRLARETKAAFLEGWYRRDEDLPSAITDDEAEPPLDEGDGSLLTAPGVGEGTASPDPGASGTSTTVTLPDGSTLTESYDDSGALIPGGRVVRDRRGDVIQVLPDDVETLEEATVAEESLSSNRWFGLPRNVAIGGAASIVVLAAVVGFVAVSGGDDQPEPSNAAATSVAGASTSTGGQADQGNGTTASDSDGPVAVFAADDATDDIGPQASDLTAIEDPNLAGDITSVSAEVNADANETQLMIWFAGDAQALQASSGAELGAGVLVKPADGSRGLDLIYRTDGSSKGSDPPAGFSLDVSWYRSDVLLFAIGGYAPPSGSVIEFQTFQTENFAFSSDIATLTVDEDDADFLRYAGEFGGLRVE